MPVPYMNPAANSQRDAIAQTLMGIAQPPPQANIPQLPQGAGAAPPPPMGAPPAPQGMPPQPQGMPAPPMGMPAAPQGMPQQPMMPPRV
jgi:hypothetical protein